MRENLEKTQLFTIFSAVDFVFLFSPKGNIVKIGIFNLIVEQLLRT